MESGAIEAEHDYDAALQEIEALFGAETSSPEGARLEQLLALVGTYEARHWPIEPAAESAMAIGPKA
jgi:HTH-type transcriptional regulator/antitoxin HigA